MSRVFWRGWCWAFGHIWVAVPDVEVLQHESRVDICLGKNFSTVEEALTWATKSFHTRRLKYVFVYPTGYWPAKRCSVCNETNTGV